MKCAFVFMFLFAFSFTWKNGIAQTNDRKMIIGRWVSVDDRKYVVVFTSTEKREYYDKALSSVYSYSIKNDSLIAKDKSDGDVFYYSIENLSKKYLSLMYLGR